MANLRLFLSRSKRLAQKPFPNSYFNFQTTTLPPKHLLAIKGGGTGEIEPDIINIV